MERIGLIAVDSVLQDEQFYGGGSYFPTIFPEPIETVSIPRLEDTGIRYFDPGMVPDNVLPVADTVPIAPAPAPVSTTEVTAPVEPPKETDNSGLLWFGLGLLALFLLAKKKRK